MVLVDQFEELFTVCRDDAERQAFIGNLLYAARVAQGQNRAKVRKTLGDVWGGRS